MARRTEMAAKHKNRLDQLTRIASGYADLINLRPNWSNEHPLPRHVVDAAKDAVDRMHSYRFFGMRELRVAIAEKLERENGLKVDPETEMLVTTGGSEAIYLAIWSMIDPGDQVIMGNPGYVAGYEPNVMMAGGRVVYVPTGEERKFKIDPEAVEKSITGKTKMIVIVSPENPIS
jgi:aspartate/methionine/tyrosine aminotransferase